MPLFRYHITCGTETRTIELRKSNPQGWLLDAVTATFPEIASRRAADVMRLRLEAVSGVKQSWRAMLPDERADLMIQVSEARS
ncbi:hypothetical protein [uncultured Caulobacter sp.]|uniref:hypothetical protein n=1 Tax=uncultured Caulobacter sp. TaxID=158749 RepID=UPI0026167850|nr:hypothetical protein [uncultured Caulobacter sp.]